MSTTTTYFMLTPTEFTSTVSPAPLLNLSTSTTFYNVTMTPSSSSSSTIITTTIKKSSTNNGGFESDLIIPLYVIIFILSMAGNSLVLITLAQNRRMRTVTNVFLLNLAVSDLLLGVFCMPFTLVGQVLRNFVFGHLMCKLIPYFQAVSVSVGVWTLVAISLERYFAICRPLKSRRWQTRFHAYKMIGIVWLGSLVWNLPILVVSKLKAMREKGRHKCREVWPSPASERSFNISLDLMLLVVPLLVMALAYALIVSKLWKGLRREIEHNQHQHRCASLMQLNGTVATSLVDVPAENNSPTTTQNFDESTSVNQASMLNRSIPVSTPNTSTGCSCRHLLSRFLAAFRWGKPDPEVPLTSLPQRNAGGTTTYTFGRHTAIRSNYMDKSIESKKKVIRMLFVIVLEFFVCWTPLHVLNTWYLFHPEAVYKIVGSTGVSLVQLLAYISSCCNPITYCFMNKKFRQAFIGAFDCFKQKSSLFLTNRGSEISANESALYAGRASTVAKSLGVLEAEDRV